MVRSTGDANEAGPYVESYLQIRKAVGIVGIALPFVFIIGEGVFLSGGLHIRGSLSAYYHTSMRDAFVAGLSVIGFLLATFMYRKIASWRFWLTLLAGVTLLGVAFIPTERLGLSADATRCGGTPTPDGCSAVQQLLGEKLAAGIHFGCAIVFVLSLAVISFMFAREESDQDRRGVARFQAACGIIIAAMVIIVVPVGEAIGAQVWELTPLYVGEVVSVWAFGASWFLASQRVQRSLRRP